MQTSLRILELEIPQLDTDSEGMLKGGFSVLVAPEVAMSDSTNGNCNCGCTTNSSCSTNGNCNCTCVNNGCSSTTTAAPTSSTSSIGINFGNF
jgi:hypothetical protein